MNLDSLDALAIVNGEIEVIGVDGAPKMVKLDTVEGLNLENNKLSDGEELKVSFRKKQQVKMQMIIRDLSLR